MFAIRPETSDDVDAIREVNRLAFGGDDEARLVDLLRSSGDVLVSLVAVAENRVIGDILFSPLVIETPEGEILGAALAPLAVTPEWQRRGVGSALVRAGLEECRRQEFGAVIVLGHPEYYPRFGFSPDLARALRSPFGEQGDAWMALELVPGSLSTVSGLVRYADAFKMLP